MKQYLEDFKTFEHNAESIEKFVLTYEAHFKSGLFVLDKHIVENYLSAYQEHKNRSEDLFAWIQKLNSFIGSLGKDENGDQHKNGQTVYTQTIQEQFGFRAKKYSDQVLDLHQRLIKLREQAREGLTSILAGKKKFAAYNEKQKVIDGAIKDYMGQMKHKYEFFSALSSVK